MSSHNLSLVLDRQARRRPDTTALVHGDARWTYADLLADVQACAVGLRDHGVGPGVHVALLGMNSANYLIAAVAVSRLGGVFVPLNPRLARDELDYLVPHAEARLLLADRELLETADAVAATSSSVGVPVALDQAVEGRASVDGWRTEHRGESVPCADVGADDLQRIMYTSGTTSRPKGAMLTHGNVTWNMVAQTIELGLGPHDRILNFAPMHHVGGLDIPGFGIWYVGGTMVVMRRFDPESILALTGAHGITGMCMVATMVHRMRESPALADADTSSVRWLIFSQVAPRLYEDTQQVFPGATLIEGYGLTETCNGVAYLDAEHAREKLGSVGLPLPHVELRVVDEQGRDVPIGERGEVAVRGPKVSPGYWKDPDATASVHREGWFHTGDIGQFDLDGYLSIVDRKKDMIRSGGENVASSEIERVLYDHPDVAEAAVVGVPHEEWHEVPCAVVVLVEGATVTADELVAHCRSSLAGFKVPKRFEFVAELPRNVSGKVLKTDLRERVAVGGAA